MKQKYTFFDGGAVTFDDERSVRELIAHAFSVFDYYEPMGMDVVTLFQGHHPDTDDGWLTTDVSRSCRDEIKNPDELFFAYYMPGMFYFAEGGWGHHMPHLGNHPLIDNAVSLPLRFEDFDHTVVINGSYTFSDVIRTLLRTEYIDGSCSRVVVINIGCSRSTDYSIAFTDPVMNLPLTEFEATINRRNKALNLAPGDFIYGTIFHIQ